MTNTAASTRHQTRNAATEISYRGPKGRQVAQVDRSLSQVTQDFAAIGYTPVMINGATNVLINGDEQVTLNRA